jgi:hypothetical protein
VRDLLGGALLDLRLQLGRQLGLMLTVDVLLVGLGLLAALVGESVESGLYVQAVLVPLVLLGVPVIADTVALERRAGCIELALTSPAGERYFLRRVAVVTVLFAVQGTVVMTIAWLALGRGFALLTVLLQLLAVTAFVAAATLFWAARLGAAGGVWLASLATVAVASPWCFWGPVVVPLPGQARVGALLPGWLQIWEWASRAVPLAVAALLLLLYARRRLRRAETLLDAG